MVLCIIRDPEGVELGRFHPTGRQPLLTEALDAGIFIPFACQMGACANCAARIIRGGECLTPEAYGDDLIGADRGTVLTCIAGVDASKVADDDEHVIELATVL